MRHNSKIGLIQVGKGITDQIHGGFARVRTVDNLDALFRAATDVGIPVFISPHYYYYYEHDHQWRFEGALEKLNPVCVTCTSSTVQLRGRSAFDPGGPASGAWG